MNSYDPITAHNAPIQLSATPIGNGYPATVTFPDGVSMSSAEIYARVAEAIAAATRKRLDMPERLAALDEPGSPPAS